MLQSMVRRGVDDCQQRRDMKVLTMIPRIPFRCECS